MSESILARLFQRAADDPHFRARFLSNWGMTLAEEGFILTDGEMATLRDLVEGLQNLSDRAAYERIFALSRRRF